MSMETGVERTARLVGVVRGSSKARWIVTRKAKKR